MSDHERHNKDKALHQLIEDEFQQLVDIIEQKQIVHEDIELQPQNHETILVDPIQQAANRLQQHSRALGADTLAKYFHELEHSAQDGSLLEDGELLRSINDEFKSVKDILSDPSD